MENVNTFLFVLALFLALVIMVIFGVCMRIRQEKIQIEADKDVVTFALYSKISFEWKFLETLVDELFSDKDEEVQSALKRFFKEAYEIKEYQVTFVKIFLLHFEEEGLVSSENVTYSKVTLQEYPYLFKTLPEWKRYDCESLVNQPVNFPQSQEETIIRVKKNPNGTFISRKPKKEEKNHFWNPEPLSALN